MKSLDELNAERSERAKAILDPVQIKRIEEMARLHAEANDYKPPSTADFGALADHVYLMAYSRRKYKIAKEKRSHDIGTP